MAIPTSPNDQSFNDSLTNTATNYIRQTAQDDRHHNEIMTYIAELNKVKADYKNLSERTDQYVAGYNEMAAILKEHLHEISISKDEANQRVNAAMDKALEEHKRRQGA